MTRVLTLRQTTGKAEQPKDKKHEYHWGGANGSSACHKHHIEPPHLPPSSQPLTPKPKVKQKDNKEVSKA